MSSTETKVRLVSFGPIPPEWGGPTAGGVATYHANLLAALSSASSRYETTLVPNRAGFDVEALPAGVKVRSLGPKHRTPEMVRELTGQSDALIFHHLGNKWADAYAASGIRQFALCFVHSWTAIKLGTTTREHIQANLNAMDVLVFPSRNCREEGRLLGLEWSMPTCVLYPYPQITESEAVTAAGRGGRSGIVFLGSLTDIKRPRLLIAAAKFIRSDLAPTITIIGDGELRQDLENEAKKLGVHGLVRFTGQLPTSSVLPHLRSAGVLCVPSASEGFSLAYVEALSQGTPVVGYEPNISELRDVLGMECGYGFAGSDPEVLGRILEEALARPWPREDLCERTKELFSPLAMTKGFAKALGSA